MTSTLIIRQPDDDAASSTSPSTLPTYWSESNHNSNSFLRIENWKTPEIAAYCLPSSFAPVSIPLSLSLVNALLKYREEIKFYAALADEQQQQRQLAEENRQHSSTIFSFSWKSSPPPTTSPSPIPIIPSIEQPQFLDFHFQRVRTEWKLDKRSEWLNELQQFEEEINSKIRNNFSNQPIFIKLSVRSPKDAVFCLQSTYDQISHSISTTSPPLPLDSPLLLHSNIQLIKLVAYNSLRIQNGEEAIHLLTRSNRIYLDLLQAELFSHAHSDNSPPPLDISLHLMEYCTEFNPNYEFRGFCSNGKMTSLTIYNPWVYEPLLIEKKDQIFHLILDLWKKIARLYPGKDYCLDFALNSELTKVYLIEINAFLPPLAGSGLFNMNNIDDQNIIKYGVTMTMQPSTTSSIEEDSSSQIVFRLRESYVREEELCVEKVDQFTGKKVIITYAPAPEGIMRFIMRCREEALGITRHQESQEQAVEVSEKSTCVLM